MPVDPSRIITRFYIGGNYDQTPGSDGPASGYLTFDECADAIDLLYQGDPNGHMLYYVLEVKRILREEV